MRRWRSHKDRRVGRSPAKKSRGWPSAKTRTLSISPWPRSSTLITPRIMPVRGMRLWPATTTARPDLRRARRPMTLNMVSRGCART